MLVTCAVRVHTVVIAHTGACSQTWLMFSWGGAPCGWASCSVTSKGDMYLQPDKSTINRLGGDQRESFKSSFCVNYTWVRWSNGQGCGWAFRGRSQELHREYKELILQICKLKIEAKVKISLIGFIFVAHIPSVLQWKLTQFLNN